MQKKIFRVMKIVPTLTINYLKQEEGAGHVDGIRKV
jgi:hypothetical protein